MVAGQVAVWHNHAAGLLDDPPYVWRCEAHGTWCAVCTVMPRCAAFLAMSLLGHRVHTATDLHLLGSINRDEPGSVQDSSRPKVDGGQWVCGSVAADSLVTSYWPMCQRIIGRNTESTQSPGGS